MTGSTEFLSCFWASTSTWRFPQGVCNSVALVNMQDLWSIYRICHTCCSNDGKDPSQSHDRCPFPEDGQKIPKQCVQNTYLSLNNLKNTSIQHEEQQFLSQPLGPLFVPHSATLWIKSQTIGSTRYFIFHHRCSSRIPLGEGSLLQTYHAPEKVARRMIALYHRELLRNVWY